MKPMCRVLMATTFLVPAFLISSCDDKNTTPVGPSDDPSITDIQTPSLTTVGFGSKWHDPHIKGPKVRYFINDEFCPDAPRAKRFKSEDGAEVAIVLPEILDRDAGSLEDACDVGVYPATQKIRGKKVGEVKELDFSYAGGDQNGFPTMRIPIDECIPLVGETPGEVYPCTTDGVAEGYLYIQAPGCNDGDSNVGVVNAEDKEECAVVYDTEYPNWNAFVTAHPDYRIARKIQNFFTDELEDALTSVFLTAFFGESHYLIWMIDVR